MATNKWPMAWNARWIWASPIPTARAGLAPAGIPRRDTWNRFCYLRRALDLESVPHSVAARVTADSRFVLYVNGAEVARGPARSMPERLAWTDVDLAPHLRKGRNAIAALVRFYGAPGPWWLPAAPSYHVGLGSFAFEAPTIGIATDASWKGHPAPYQREVEMRASLPVPPTEILDGREVPLAWSGADFDDSNWDAAVALSAGTFAPNRTLLPVEPYSAPEAADVAPLTSIPVNLIEIDRRNVATSAGKDPREAYPASDSANAGTDSAFTFDAGGTTIATPWIEASGPAGAIVDIYSGEDLRADGLAEIDPRLYAMRYILRGSGVEPAEGFEAVGMRYLTVIARGGARVDSVGATERRYPREGNAHFECDDPALNKIWRVGARTLELCATDAFIDCPGREQRAWLGDSYIHALLTYTTNTDWRLVRRHLRICAHSRRRDGLLAMVAAGDASAVSTTIPDYSLHWIRTLARYFEYSADVDTVRELIPTAVEILGAFERYRAADGLIRRLPGWTFIDWAMIDKSDATAAIDALYAAALDDFAALASAASLEPHIADDAQRRAAQTRTAFELYWDESRGVYVDAADANGRRRRVSQQTNAAAIVGGCAPRERWPRMLAYILDDSRIVITPTISDNMMAYVQQRMNPADHQRFDAERDVVAAQPFFSHFLHDAIVRAGRRDLIPARCMKWWPQIERGDTVFEEYWDARSGTGSRCHAWSATPTFDLTAHVLGVRPTAPAFATVEIAPLFGRLRHLEGRVPTPNGMIEVILDRERGGEIALPNGVVANLRFDDAALKGGAIGSRRHHVEVSR
jgi:alpha-L-rhamnosidase